MIETSLRNGAKSDRKGRGRQRRDTRAPERHGFGIPMTREGMPAAAPGTPTPVSPVVSVQAESREQFPWLPARVIAGSVWRGPSHDRVRVDLNGQAVPVTTAPRRL